MRLARAQGCGAVKFFVPKHADLGSRCDALTISMTTEQELREKLRKISALFEGATTIGERHAAAAAIDRVRKALAVAAQTEQPVETQFTLSDRWSRRRVAGELIFFPRFLKIPRPATILRCATWPFFSSI